MEDLGLYVSLLPDGTLKRKLVHLKLRGGNLEDALHDYPIDGPLSVFDKVEEKLPDSTVEQEIIEFSELNFGPYVQVIIHRHELPMDNRFKGRFARRDAATAKHGQHHHVQLHHHRLQQAPRLRSGHLREHDGDAFGLRVHL